MLTPHRNTHSRPGRGAAAPDLVQWRRRLALAALQVMATALTGSLLLAASARAATLEVQVSGADGKPIAEAVAYLESPTAQAAARALKGLEIEQKDRQFTQRVSVVPLGSEVEFPNRDKVRHHVYSVSPAKTFDLKLYIGKPANPVLFDRAGVAVLGCNIHDEMVAFVVVVPTPYYGQSGANGSVKLDNVPAGSYQLLVWHPDLPVGAPARAQAVNVPAGGMVVNVKLPVTGY
jgi:plastocyanin